jgi:hypothetical protein
MRTGALLLSVVAMVSSSVASAQGRVLLIDERGKVVGYREPRLKAQGNRFFTQGGGQGFGVGGENLPLYAFRLDGDDEEDETYGQGGSVGMFGGSNVRSRGAISYVWSSSKGGSDGMHLGPESVKIPDGMDLYYDLRTGKSWFWPAFVPCPVPPLTPAKRRQGPIAVQ